MFSNSSLGNIQVTIYDSLSRFETLMCHCTNCKRRSGGIASYAFVIPKDVVSVTGSSHISYEDPNTGSGKPMTRTMCEKCGSPVIIIETSAPDMRCVQYGIFAGEELPPPKMEMFRSLACAWTNSVGEEIREEA